MSDKTFIDTNVLIYAHDFRSPEKRAIANALLREMWANETGVLSPQVLQEFYVNSTSTRKLAKPLSKPEARSVVETYEPWCTVISYAEIASAFRIEDEYKVNFWDALIVSCAVRSGAVKILSEDLNAGQRYAGILVENPFANPRR